MRRNWSLSLHQKPLNGSNGTKDIVLGNCWVGEIPITVSGDAADQQTMAYWMKFDKTVYVCSSYVAELALVADTAEWRGVS